MRLLVCGGREFEDRRAVFAVLDRLLRRLQAKMETIDVVIHGNGRGADFLAEEWAKERSIPTEPYPADWDRLGVAAGPIRNQQMIDIGRPDGVVAFPGDRGTADMVKRALAARIRVWEPFKKERG